MSRSDFYASPFGVAYSGYMERPFLSRLVAKVVWGGDIRHYYESMRAAAAVPAGTTIVDCPCGAGPALRALDAESNYLGVDLSPAMLRRARKRARARGLHGVELIRTDATEIPLPSQSAGLFLSYWGLHCFSNPSDALAEAARVLEPGGRLVGSTFVSGEESLRQRLLIRSGRGDFGIVPTPEQVTAWLGQAGFVDSAILRSGPMLFFQAQRD